MTLTCPVCGKELDHERDSDACIANAMAGYREVLQPFIGKECDVGTIKDMTEAVLALKRRWYLAAITKGIC